jgi:betaine lipid synthase
MPSFANLPSSSLAFTPLSSSSLHLQIGIATGLVVVLVGAVIYLSFFSKIDYDRTIFSYFKFFYASFLKPHDGGEGGQQNALESFYKTQVRWFFAKNRNRRRMLMFGKL